MSGFAERLAALIGEGSISAFARKVGLSEALIRKYLKGAEPGLAKANQIAMGANCSLEWLATGCGYLYRQAEVVDREALLAARSLLAEQESLPPLETEQLVRLLAYYQFLRTHKKGDGFLDLALAREFGRRLEDA
ncbi:XRE family transcriptional regulator [Aeromonas schubertii]|uniref:XRE family transcriptional regulator n=1 Tax=Aeromonas schubertii TaxID=652 RepID=A0ABS7VEQ9_9GAMM|nr:XRE family transcriptional regulator [Aeromonas schubertii]MBZ6067552.1 XRE family transcriptional regulator [Aeromonas schubertii]QCG47983.1 XRE family transcriptional regulator [Aeromonas schubertii]